MNIYRGTTPDITMTFPQGSVDFTLAEDVLITIRNQRGDLLLNAIPSVTENELTLFLSQEQSLAMQSGTCYIMANWTYQENGVLKRGCSQIYPISIKSNLHNEVM